jgi:hypothetical protein
MAKNLPKLKLGKSASFVKTHLKQLKQDDDTWEADFRALPKHKGQTETHYLGLFVALPSRNPLVCFPLVEYIVRALDYGGLVFEDDKPRTLAEAMVALESALAERFKEV